MTDWANGLPQLLMPLYDEFEIAGVRNPAHLEAARQTGFVWTARPGVVCLAMTREYLRTAIQNPCVVAIVVPPALASGPVGDDKALVVAGKPDELYHHLHLSQCMDGEGGSRVDETAVIDPSALLAGQVSIGARVRIGPRVIVNGPVVIGDDVQIDAGAIIGCDGLYAKVVRGSRQHILHFGGVEIGENAYIHAGATIVRSAIRNEATCIAGGSHIGPGSVVGHDVQVGRDATISSNAVIAGRARVGARAWIGASATISNMVVIGEGAKVRLGAVVLQDVPENGDVSGNFALAHSKNMKSYLRANRDGS